MRRVLTLAPTTLLLLAVTGASPLRAQELARPSPAPLDGTSTPVDETALRYYAATGQAARRDAEARRLQWLYPGWRVPDDLDREEAGREDEAPLWALFAADRLDDLATALAARRAAEPGWIPSAALRGKFERKKRRAAVLAAASDGRWAAAVEAAGGVPDLDVDVLWTVAEAQARLGRDADAAVSFRLALERSRDAHERIVTVQKALALLPFPQVEPLLAFDRPDATGRAEFAGLSLDVTRARLVWALAATGRDAPSDATLQAFAAQARERKAAGDAALLGWWALRRKEPGDAAGWFTEAMEAEPDPATAHGLAQALDALGRSGEAEDLAFAWRERSPANALLYVTLASRALLAPAAGSADANRIGRLARAAWQLEPGDAAQALAWYAFRACQFSAAAEWFRLAMAWRPRESSAKGQVLALLRLGHRAEAADIVNRYDGLFPAVVALAFDTGERGPERCGPAPAVRPVRSLSTAAGTVAITLPFPAATTAENAAAPARPPGAVRGPASPTPLVARRVPGAGPMPYEAYGFTLLPSWNGSETATLPAYAERRAPRGTLDGDDARAGDGLGPQASALSFRTDADARSSGGRP